MKKSDKMKVAMVATVAFVLAHRFMDSLMARRRYERKKKHRARVRQLKKTFPFLQ